MNQLTHLKCPVCGAERPSNSNAPRCVACNFPSAFAVYFADSDAYQAWRREIDRRTRLPLPELQKKMAGKLALGESLIGVDAGGALLTIDDITCDVRRRPDIRQISIGERHTVFLNTDGEVTAEGTNYYGQCDFVNGGKVERIAAGPTCTYAVRNDGRVQFFGMIRTDTPQAELRDGEVVPFLRGWEDVEQLVCGGELIAGVTRDGRLLLGGFPPWAQDEQSAKAETVSGVVSAAAAGGCVLALLKDGTIRFFGNPNDQRIKAERWTDITAVAVDNQFAYGLTQSGSVLVAGATNAARGDVRFNASKWNNVVAIACSYSSVAAVTSDGALLLEVEGDDQFKNDILDEWQKNVQPELQRSFRRAGQTALKTTGNAR